MSERQAKKIRKEQVTEKVKVPKDKGKIMFYVISAVVILGFAGLAGYSIGKEIKSTNVETAAEDVAAPDTSTLGGLAESKGQTFEEFALEAGLDTTVFTADMSTSQAYEMFTVANAAMVDYGMTFDEFAAENGIDTTKITADMLYSDAVNLFTVANAAKMNYGLGYDEFAAQYNLDTTKITADMPYSEASDLFTLENIAAFSGMDGETLKTNAGLPADVDTNVSLVDLPTSVMLTFNGITNTLDELRGYGLPENITDETRWGDAKEAIEAAVAVANTTAALEAESETATEATETADGGAE